MVDKSKSYGEMAFLGGIVLALVLGAASSILPAGVVPLVWAVWALLGLVVGFLNINDKEVMGFLVAAIALLQGPNALSSITGYLSTSVNATVGIVMALNGFLGALAAFIAPAAFIVALKAIYKMAKSE